MSNEEFFKLKSKVDRIEERVKKIESDFDPLPVRVGTLEKAHEELSEKIEKMDSKLETFKNEIKEDLSNFMNTITKDRLNLIKWLIGLITGSLFAGLFFQYQSFHGVHENINKVKERVIIIEEANKKDNGK